MASPYMRRVMAVLGAAALIASGSMTFGAGSAEAAPQCAPRKISATGGNSGMSYFAKAKARAAWIKKVSDDARLGPTYAQWLRAADRRTVCRKVDNRFVCLAVALPCRSPRVVIVAPQERRAADVTHSVRPVKPARPL